MKSLFMQEPWAKAFSRKMLLDGGILFDEGLACWEDVLFNLRAAFAFCRGKYVPVAAYRYLQRPGSVMHRYFDDLLPTYSGYVAAMDALFAENGVSGAYEDRFCTMVWERLAFCLLRDAFKKAPMAEWRSRARAYGAYFRSDGVFRRASAYNTMKASPARWLLVFLFSHRMYSLCYAYCRFSMRVMQAKDSCRYASVVRGSRPSSNRTVAAILQVTSPLTWLGKDAWGPRCGKAGSRYAKKAVAGKPGKNKGLTAKGVASAVSPIRLSWCGCSRCACR